MAYSHSFAPSFYGDPYEAAPSKRPTTVCDALASLSNTKWRAMVRDVFNITDKPRGGVDPADVVGIEDVLAKIIETDTVSNLTVPVSVWIDAEGFHTIDVYDE
jgi:hypothetical protein